MPSLELQIRETKEVITSIKGKTVTEREDFRPPELNPRKYFTWEAWENSKEWQDWLNDKEKQKKHKEWKLKNK